MARGEISDKLAKEVLDEMLKAERWCDEMYHKNGESTDWLTASCLVFNAKAHLIHHVNQNEEIE